ncbi:hypothetical protein [Salinigranum sp. GCM10025319]|uniref:hypothetical protein n=1 Tax=Salinigranum sp. GCM10025319 TaxID=3252687 RepID=UPI003611D3F0
MNLDELRSVQRAERQKDSLQHLRDEFYADVAAYVAQLKDERERAVAAADDPFASEDVRQLTDKIESTKETANALYERRVGKVVKHASFAAADMATDEEGMTTEERELFTDLVARIRENRQTVLATLDGESGGTNPNGPAVEADAAATDREGPTDAGTRTDAADAPADADTPTREVGGSTDGSEPSPSGSTDDLLADALGDTGPDAVDGAPAAGSEASAPASADSAAATDGTSVPDRDGDSDRPTDEARSVSGGPAPESSSTETAQVESVASDRQSDGSATATADATAAETEDAGETPADTDRTTLKITADVGTVYGVDEREYDLAREDVVTLPTTNAEPLLRKDAAERIDFD